MDDQKHQNEAADGRSALTAVLGEVAELLSIVDNMGEHRHELMEEAVKDIDRRLALIRERFSAEQSLEGKLAVQKDQRELEKVRKQRRDRMFELIDNGAIYAHDPLTRCELEALVRPLRAAVTLRFEVERLRAALVHIECEPINAEYMARAALDGPNKK